MIKTKLLLITASACALAALPAGAVIVVPNGNFQQIVGSPPVTSVATAKDWNLSALPTLVAGDYQSGDWAGAGRNVGATPHYGEIFQAPNRGKDQSITTASPLMLTGTKSGVYQVQFWAMDYNPNQTAASRPAVSGTFAVTLDGLTEDVTINGSYNHLDPNSVPTSTPGNATGYGGHYVEYVVDFPLGSSPISTYLSFTWQGDSNGTKGGEGLLDNVSIVPEPSTWIGCTSMLIPFGMSAFRVLRRKRMV